MITVLFIILVSVAIVQYVYQSILLPTIRQELRFRMFALRDKLRHYAYDEVIYPESRVYRLLQGRINITVDYLYLVDVKALFDAYRLLKENPAISKRIEKHRQLIESCEIPEVREIDGQLNRFLTITLLANSACFFLWFGFLLLMLLTIHRTGKTLWCSAKDLVLDMPYVPEREIAKFAPKVIA